jgi:hypothetical protein
MCSGVLRGLVIIKLSESPRKLGLIMIKVIKNIRKIIYPIKSLMIKNGLKGILSRLKEVLNGLELPVSCKNSK